MATIEVQLRGGGRSRLIGQGERAWLVALSGEPDEADQALAALLAELLNVPHDCVEVDPGDGPDSRHVFVSALDQPGLEERLLGALGGPAPADVGGAV